MLNPASPKIITGKLKASIQGVNFYNKISRMRTSSPKKSKFATDDGHIPKPKTWSDEWSTIVFNKTDLNPKTMSVDTVGPNIILMPHIIFFLVN